VRDIVRVKYVQSLDIRLGDALVLQSNDELMMEIIRNRGISEGKRSMQLLLIVDVNIYGLSCNEHGRSWHPRYLNLH